MLKYFLSPAKVGHLPTDGDRPPTSPPPDYGPALTALLCAILGLCTSSFMDDVMFSYRGVNHNQALRYVQMSSPGGGTSWT